MNILILAAGYATRLYPLTEKQPKPLLNVAGKPMIEWVIDNLGPIPNINRLFIVTNNKFADTFTAWAAEYGIKNPNMNCTIINDGSTSDEDKRGAIGDIHYVLHHEKIMDEDLLVIAGDNLFSEPIDRFVEESKAHPATVALYDVGDLEAIKKYNNITTDAAGKITHFEEKPLNPTSTLTGIALYYYRADVLPFIDTYIAEGNNPDQPGRLIQWLYPRVEVGTWNVPGTWFDIGSKETLLEANEVFAKFQ
ncbi:MAG: nucleotidyltransferase family protein [Verrucomicrobiae bacterium]|jgi:glucose-1-phosphate thymidylyltransferase|nr:nucleotidyltransferase family protein [Verrucomicrobiae bacterium]